MFSMILLRMMKAEEPESNCIREAYQVSSPYNYVIWIVLPIIVRICQVGKDYLLNVALEKRKQTSETTKNLMP
jgi:hypothetical protein